MHAIFQYTNIYFLKIYTKKNIYMPYTYEFNFIDLFVKKICILSSQRENSLRT